ncbi:hypothetical protein J421_0524 [Gemmatirosa kalamazoonensis]|uniref:DUF4175 domain-containing protein n=1 Tax=Gemmatirosa kalamazoonensis TaxID=861299 RepID=W0RB86_9BACT|nr:hypothetical protein [Gemmatirosa kalamazoonensis]AHG88061.1 hypothetical protein J421_0524 [Gemmatirosa kalamazoonensis]
MSTGRPGDAARARLRGARLGLRAIVVAHAVLWGAAAAAVVALARAMAGDARAAWWDVLTVAASVGVALLAMLRAAPRGVSTERAALWVEARVPTLRYALVTLADGAPVPDAAARALDATVRAARWSDALRRAAVRATVAPLVVLVAAVALARVVPARAVTVLGRGGPAATTASIDRLRRVRATVVPPAYSGLPSQRLDDPSAVEALVGSAVVVEGDGPAAGLLASVAGGEDSSSTRATLVVESRDEGWRVRLGMPERPAALRLGDGARTRFVVLAPRADAPPQVTLSLPARDTVLREAVGTLPLAARAEDDLGLGAAQFEWIVSSGEGESFKFRNGVVGRTSLGGRAAAMRASLSLAALELKPGDIVHLRAVARDRHPDPRHPSGASETRTLRIARAGEYDSVAVDAAPPMTGDTSQLGQRMLLQLTEALVKRQRALPRPTVLAESRTIAQDQARLRKRVGDLVFQRLGESEGEETQGESGKRASMTPEELLAAANAATGQDLAKPLEGEEEETPVLAVNRPLLEAYNHMWDAGRALEIGEPARAIPPMRRAILALERARAAERIYLRGRPPAAVVDLSKVRLAARLSPDTMHLAARTARPPLDARTRARLTSLGRAVALLPGDASAAADTLALLRVDALADAPTLAAALGEAAEALRAGRDATAALVRARRIAAGGAARVDSLGGWAW